MIVAFKAVIPFYQNIYNAMTGSLLHILNFYSKFAETDLRNLSICDRIKSNIFFKKRYENMIEASKLKAGMTFETADGKLIRVLEASHHKPGKGNTIMRMKLRDVRTGSTFDTSYRPEEKFEQAIIETVPAQYLYKKLTSLEKMY